MVAVSRLTVCAHCGHDTGIPGDTWLAIRPLRHIMAAPATLCSARCAVLWLERQHEGMPL